MEECMFTLLKLTSTWVFFTFLNCKIYTKLRKVSHIINQYRKYIGCDTSAVYKKSKFFL